MRKFLIALVLFVGLIGLISLPSFAFGEIQFGADFLDEMMSVSQAKKIECPSKFVKSIDLYATCYKFPINSADATEVYKKNWDENVESISGKLQYSYNKTQDWKNNSLDWSTYFKLEGILYGFSIDDKSYFGDLIAVFNTLPIDPFIFGNFFMRQDDKEIAKSKNVFIVELDELQYSFLPTSKAIQFKIQNNSKKTVKIVWDESTIVSINKEALAVFHSGIKYTDIEKPQLPTIVPARSFIGDLVLPKKSVRYSSGLKEWIVENLFNPKVKDILTLNLVIDFDGEKKTHSFDFGFTATNRPTSKP